MKTNLKAFELSVKGIKLKYGSSAENVGKFKKKLELAELHVHIDDGNYNEKMLKRAIKLAKEFRDGTTKFEKKLHKLKAEGREEAGSRGRMLILDQVMDIIKKNVNLDDSESKICPNYLKAVDELEKLMEKTSCEKGERGYDEEIKVAWVNIREAMYAEQLEEMYVETKNKERRTLSEHTMVAKANVKPSNSSRYTHIPSRDDRA
ncbi:MAG: hypothetical protein PHX01_01905 [Clostridia bacterium]|nr:hypothetical protein [Clostridia bacterium]